MARLMLLSGDPLVIGSTIIAIGDLTLDERQMRRSAWSACRSIWRRWNIARLPISLHNQGRASLEATVSEQIHGTQDAYDSNAIEALIADVERKIDGDVIKTRRGFGYIIAEQGP